MHQVFLNNDPFKNLLLFFKNMFAFLHVIEAVVTYEYLKALLAKSKDLILIDVREKDEVDKGCIPRSVHIALGTVEEAFKMGPEDFQARYGIPKPALDAPELVFYCRSGRRSAQALSKVRELGYVTARNYAGSYLDWSSREG
uniref:Thiosulfate sulfurtransferase/rhodanese domain-containing 1-like protein n=1 Tax=Fundulus heteroclitus TaxID=8078 RepID=A0A146WRW0_FUNHE